MRPIVSDLLTRLGIRMTVHKRGAFKDLWSPFREPTKEEEAREQALIDEFYERFVRSVADARGMNDERVREIATGEVFTGAKALEAGLVDETGDFETAVAAAMRLGGVERRLVTYRPRRTLRERLLGGFATEIGLALEDALWRGAYGTFEFRDRAPGGR
jgi:protease-4